MNRALFGMVIVATCAALAWGFSVVGGPETARMEKRDATRFSDLRQLGLHYRCIDHQLNTAEKAISPTYCNGQGASAPDLRDPLTNDAYPFDRSSADSFEICATFELATAPRCANRDRGMAFDGHNGCLGYVRKDAQSKWVVR